MILKMVTIYTFPEFHFVFFLNFILENESEKINVIPNALSKSSIRIEGSSKLFNITWSPVTNVNYGEVYYRLKMKIDDSDIDVCKIMNFCGPQRILFDKNLILHR